MPRAELEHRALRRELLMVRAAAERAALADHLDELSARGRGGVPGLLMRGAGSAQRSGWLRFAGSALRTVRSQPWLLPAVVGGATRLARSRTLRWLVLAGAIAGVWWLWQRSNPAESGELTSDSVEESPTSHD
jgi:hypothetical protein